MLSDCITSYSSSNRVRRLSAWCYPVGHYNHGNNIRRLFVGYATWPVIVKYVDFHSK